jgi:hypothetical protein
LPPAHLRNGWALGSAFNETDVADATAVVEVGATATSVRPSTELWGWAADIFCLLPGRETFAFWRAGTTVTRVQRGAFATKGG